MAGAEPRSFVRPRRFAALGSAIVIVLSILGSRLYDLQIVRGASYRQLAEQNRVLRLPVAADRGIILDRNKRVLVRNTPAFGVTVLPVDVPRGRQAELAERLGKLVGRDGEGVLAAIAAQRALNPYQPVRVSSRPVAREVALLLAERAEVYPGVAIVAETVRHYEDATLYAPVMGYVGPITAAELETRREQGYLLDDRIGRTGLERVYERYLRGEYGWRDIERDAAQRELKELAAMPTTPGQNLVLTLDDRLQKAIAAELAKGVAEDRFTQGVGVALNPQNGEVLAMVTVPGYDNNVFVRGITPAEMRALNADDRRPLVNKAISEIYPPGSTYKLVTALAALNEGLAHRGTTITVSSTVLTVGGAEFFDWRAHGTLDFLNGFAYSSDIFFYTLAGGSPLSAQPGVGPEKMTEYARLLGFGAPTGIDLPGEEIGILPDPKWKLALLDEAWTIGNTYHAAIGQGYVTVTPLQLLNAYAAVANGGTLYHPRLLREVVDAEGRVTFTAPTELIRRLAIAPEHLQLIREGARKVITSGMAYMPNTRVLVAGKTGTAEFGPSTGRDSAGRNLLGFHNWFVSWLPKASGDGTDAEVAMLIFTFNSSLSACVSCVSPAVTTTERIYEAYLGAAAKGKAP